MKLLITGSSGMVGRNLAENLASKYDLLLPQRSELDLLDYQNVRDFLEHNRPEFVVHCAGLVGGIQANMSNPTGFLLNNLEMGLNLIKACNETSIQKLVNLGSSCMYPKDNPNFLEEEMILTGVLEPTNEGYAIAKIAVAKLCDYMAEQFGRQYKTIIPCNLYGKYDKFDDLSSHMVPSVIKKIHHACISGQESVEIWGDGTAKREFMYINDLIDFIEIALHKIDELGQYTNVGLGQDYSVQDYYEQVANAIGFKGSFTYNISKPVGMKRKVVSIEKAKKLGWEPKTSLSDGLKMTYDYYLGIDDGKQLGI